MLETEDSPLQGGGGFGVAAPEEILSYLKGATGSNEARLWLLEKRLTGQAAVDAQQAQPGCVDTALKPSSEDGQPPPPCNSNQLPQPLHNLLPGPQPQLQVEGSKRRKTDSSGQPAPAPASDPRSQDPQAASVAAQSKATGSGRGKATAVGLRESTKRKRNSRSPSLQQPNMRNTSPGPAPAPACSGGAHRKGLHLQLHAQVGHTGRHLHAQVGHSGARKMSEWGYRGAALEFGDLVGSGV